MDNTRYPDETDRKYQGLKTYYEKVRTEQKYLQLQLHQMTHNCVWMWRVILKTLWKSLPQNKKIREAEYQSERITIHVALSGVLLRWFYFRCSWYVVTVFLGQRRAHRSWGRRIKSWRSYSPRILIEAKSNNSCWWYWYQTHIVMIKGGDGSHILRIPVMLFIPSSQHPHSGRRIISCHFSKQFITGS